MRSLPAQSVMPEMLAKVRTNVDDAVPSPVAPLSPIVTGTAWRQSAAIEDIDGSPLGPTTIEGPWVSVKDDDATQMTGSENVSVSVGVSPAYHVVVGGWIEAKVGPVLSTVNPARPVAERTFPALSVALTLAVTDPLPPGTVKVPE